MFALALKIGVVQVLSFVMSAKVNMLGLVTYFLSNEYVLGVETLAQRSCAWQGSALAWSTASLLYLTEYMGQKDIL